MSTEIDPSDAPDTEVQSWVQKLGPGLIKAAADDDPSGIATYSQATPSSVAVDHHYYVLFDGGHPGGLRKTGASQRAGLGTNIRRYYAAWLLFSSVVLLLVANTINIAETSPRWGRRSTW